MQLGVQTVGHATLIAFDGRPVLATDPWLGDAGAFFGSWQLTHAIPPAARAAVAACPFLWISHAHPDHLCPTSLATLRAATLLLPDHHGGRMARELAARGHRVRILPDRRWVALSPRIRACCLADEMQNAVLLLDVGGRLFLDVNDASDRGWGEAVRRIAAAHTRTYLLKLAPTGNLGVLNVVDETGTRLPLAHVAPERAGAELAAHADGLGATHVIPFSAFHRFQRTDSAWANAFNVPPDAHAATFAPRGGAALLPPFVSVDCTTDAVTAHAPPPLETPLLPPEAFGDDWSARLSPDDLADLRDYFAAADGFRERVGFVGFDVGGAVDRVVLDARRPTGVTFTAPRHSLLAAVRERRLDHLLLGHFTRLTLHGLPNVTPLLVPTLSRWADGGGVRTHAEVAAYRAAYRQRAAVALLDAVAGDVAALT